VGFSLHVAWQNPGSGAWPAGKGGVSLKDARDKAAQGRKWVEEGIDPIVRWNTAEAKEIPTFGKIADDFLEARGAEWRNPKHKAQWAMTLTRYCEPIRGDKAEQAYRRSDALARRRELMDARASYCEPRDRISSVILFDRQRNG
jgi:hypothetical protein